MKITWRCTIYYLLNKHIKNKIKYKEFALLIQFLEESSFLVLHVKSCVEIKTAKPKQFLVISMTSVGIQLGCDLKISIEIYSLILSLVNFFKFYHWYNFY